MRTRWRAPLRRLPRAYEERVSWLHHDAGELGSLDGLRARRTLRCLKLARSRNASALPSDLRFVGDSQCRFARAGTSGRRDVGAARARASGLLSSRDRDIAGDFAGWKARRVRPHLSRREREQATERDLARDRGRLTARDPHQQSRIQRVRSALESRWSAALFHLASSLARGGRGFERRKRNLVLANGHAVG